MFSVPVRVKKSKNKWFILNLNNYRNAHFRTLAAVKRDYSDQVPFDEIRAQIKSDIVYPVRFHYTYYPDSARIYDRMNVCSVVDKFLMDALVEKGILKDDNYKLVLTPTFEHGCVSKEPRIEVVMEQAVKSPVQPLTASS